MAEAGREVCKRGLGGFRVGYEGDRAVRWVGWVRVGCEASGKDEVWVGSEVTARAGREVWKVGLTRAGER